MKYLIGMDIGTTGVKSILMTSQGKIVARNFTEYPLLLPRPGWAEQNPEDWWRATCISLRNLIHSAGISPGAVSGISFSGQMHGLVCLDAQGNVIRPAILWCDQRTTKQCQTITRHVGRRKLIQRVYNPALEGFTLPKLQWVREMEPKNFERIFKILLPKDYVRFRLTGNLGMEVSDAAGTLMLDIANGNWSETLLKTLDISPAILPPVYRSIDIAGEVAEKAAEETGLAAGIPVVFGGADNACAAVGNGIIEEGRVAVSIGTSGTVIAPTKQVRLDPAGRVHFFNHSVPGMWYLMGVMQAAGLSLKWFRDNFAAAENVVASSTGMETYELLTLQAEYSPPGAMGLLWLPYLQGERTPHLDANARGVLFGLTTAHRRNHVLRAIMEGVAFGLRDSLEIIKSLGMEIKQIRLTGGGARSPLWRQIQADVFAACGNHEVVTIKVEEGPAFGAAIIAGVGVGIFKSFKDAADKLIRIDRVIKPQPQAAKIYDKYYQEYRRLYPALKAAFARIANLV